MKFKTISSNGPFASVKCLNPTCNTIFGTDAGSGFNMIYIKSPGEDAKRQHIRCPACSAVDWRFGWLDRLLQRFLRFRVIPDHCGEPYLVRYFLRGHTESPRGLYLHHILKSDRDDALHDHPWPYSTLILWGGYDEVLPHDHSHFNDAPDTFTTTQKMFSVLHREASSAHRLILKKPAWTLFWRGLRERKWNFITPDGKRIYWRDYLSKRPGGGCE